MITKLKENLKKAVLFLSLFTIGLYIFFSLFSHNNNDNDFFSFNSSTLQYHNHLGYLGSFISSSLIDIFGKVSYVIPFFFIFHSIRVFLNESINWYNIFSLPFLLITSCLFFEIISENNSTFIFNSGILGKGLGNYHNYFLNDFDYKTYTLWIIVFIKPFSYPIAIALPLALKGNIPTLYSIFLSTASFSVRPILATSGSQ